MKKGVADYRNALFLFSPLSNLKFLHLRKEGAKV